MPARARLGGDTQKKRVAASHTLPLSSLLADPMDAAVYLQLHHHRGPLPLPPPHPQHHHRALPPRRHSFSSASSSAAAAPSKAAAPPAARLTVSARPRSPARSASSPALAAARSSSRAATGYAAALADACVRAGTLRRAARHARAILSKAHRPPSPEEEEAVGQLDARVAALLRMLVGKGRPGMVAEVLAEFAAICDQLLPLPPPAHHAY